MNVVLYGNGSAGNHGCEAIVRGTRQLFDDANICVLSPDPKDDTYYGLNQIVDIDGATTQTIEKNLDFVRAYLKLRVSGVFTDMDGIRFLPGIRKYAKKCNVAFSVGGDNYCYQGNELYGYLNRSWKKQGVKTILWGCSVEPEVVKERRTSQDLKRYDLIVARESISYEAIAAAGANVIRAVDPAFFMEPTMCMLDRRIREKPVIGINVSPLILKYEEKDGIVLENYRRLIRHILQSTDSIIALTPHVVWSTNDDRIPLSQLAEEFADEQRVIMIEDHNAAEMKYIISQFEFFIGARTHATIAAYSSAVPTLVVGYSVKARGIAKDLFGTEENYVCPVQQLKTGTDLVEAFSSLYKDKDLIRDHLEGYLPKYKESMAIAVDAIRAIVNAADH